jgi:hypothetical protein
MITVEEAQIIVDEIKQVCDKYNVSLIGSCFSEGIYGEIYIANNEDRTSFDIGNIDNKCYTPYNAGVCVNGIGSTQ